MRRVARGALVCVHALVWLVMCCLCIVLRGRACSDNASKRDLGSTLVFTFTASCAVERWLRYCMTSGQPRVCAQPSGVFDAGVCMSAVPLGCLVKLSCNCVSICYVCVVCMNRTDVVACGQSAHTHTRLTRMCALSQWISIRGRDGGSIALPPTPSCLSIMMLLPDPPRPSQIQTR
jgi:hypothetical protein